MTIRPVLTYDSTIWWMMVNYNVSRMGLNKLHRLACLAIMGGDEDYPNSSNGGPTGTPASTCDN
jgi:hypothetical protein